MASPGTSPSVSTRRDRAVVTVVVASPRATDDAHVVRVAQRPGLERALGEHAAEVAGDHGLDEERQRAWAAARQPPRAHAAWSRR